MLLEKISETELVFAVETRDGEQFDVHVDINHGRDVGFYYYASYFLPHSAVKLLKSRFPLATQLELSAIVDAEFRNYMRTNEFSVSEALEIGEGVAV